MPSSGKPLDPLTLKIVDTYRRHLDHAARSVVAYVEAGRLLAEKKVELKKRGESWLPWLAANKSVLGFGERTANLLMKAARENPQLTADTRLDPAQEREINRKLWGNPNCGSDLWGNGGRGSGNTEWYTGDWIAPVHKLFGKIRTDPASCAEANRWIKAQTFYTKEQDGLTLPWRGKVYLNPPFQSEHTTAFVDKLIAERANGNCSEAVMLSPMWPEKIWFHKVFEHAELLCFPSKWVSYIPQGKSSLTGRPGFSSVFSYYGPNADEFATVFREIGAVVKVI